MLTLLLIMCGVTAWAWWSARRAGVNGWIGNYLLLLAANSLIVTAAAALRSENTALYGALYVVGLVPLLAAIAVVAVGWLWKSQPQDRRLVIGACIVQSAIACAALAARGSAMWDGNIPWQVQLLIVQYGILSSAGIMSLASEAFLKPRYQPIAHLLGTMWLMQAVEKALFVSGFAYHWQSWMALNRWLPQVIVICFMVGFLFKVKAFQFHQLIQDRKAQELEGQQ